MKSINQENEVFFLADTSNIFYLTGLKNSDSILLLDGPDSYFFTDEKYCEDAEAKLPDCSIQHIESLYDFISEKKYSVIGIEGTLSHDKAEKLINSGVKHFYKIDSILQKARAVKTPQEIEFIKKAQSITDKTFNDILPIIKEGMTEIELAGTLESLLFVNGADDLSFTSIVAFDENTSLPHAIRTDKKLENGSIITLDFGAKYRNYCSDMTRTFFFGSPDPDKKRIYEIVHTAQDMAISIAYSGITAKECDRIARKYFEEYGLADYFIHTLGHGVGIDIHEYPRVAKNSDTILVDNMVVTVEPGLYFPNRFGVRIEDMIIFHKSGTINLTKSPKNIIII